VSHHEPPPCTDEDCHRRVCREARQLAQRAEPVVRDTPRYNRSDRRRIWRYRSTRARMAPHPLAMR
jgi:hypothetical protein